jgi:hypothetical protein
MVLSFLMITKMNIKKYRMNKHSKDIFFELTTIGPRIKM